MQDLNLVARYPKRVKVTTDIVIELQNYYISR
jgi:hypothetical protein